jgi:hypothetical protein
MNEWVFMSMLNSDVKSEMRISACVMRLSNSKSDILHISIIFIQIPLLRKITYSYYYNKPKLLIILNEKCSSAKMVHTVMD